MTAEYTIEVGMTACIVVEGKSANARLHYYADGLHIYTKGACPVSRRDIVNYHAYEICRSHHIPLRQLKSTGWI